MSKVSGLTLMICSSALISSCATMQEKTEVTRAGDNRTMLQSVEAGQTDMVETILKSGANPDAVNEDGEPALIIALEARNAGMVETLLNAGANPDAVNEDGEPASIIALEAGHTDMVEALLKEGADPDAMNEDD